MYQIEEISWLWLGIIPIFVVILFAIDRIWKSKIQNRFEEYNKKTSKLIEYYNNQGKFYSVEGLGEINEITQRIYNLIDSKI